MMQVETMKPTKFFWFFAIFCLLIITVSSFYGLTNPYLWYDEAGQFWISMGLNHYSAPLSQRGCLSDVLASNISYNRDPGGFSVLLYFWMFISSKTFFIRLLPFLFFIGGSYFFARIAYRESKNLFFTAFLFVLPFLLPYVANKSTELRGYCIEIFGMAASVYLIMKIKERIYFWNILFLSIILSFTCTSRYASIIAAFAISLRVVYYLYKEKGLKSSIPYIVLFSLPLLVTISLIYFGQMIYQNSDAEKIPYLQYIFSSPIVLLYPLSLSFYALIVLSYIAKRKNKSLSEITICALSVGTIFFLFSLADKFPWDVIRTMPATILIWFAIAIESYQLYFRNDKHLNLYLTACLLVLSLFWILMYERLHRGDRIDSEMNDIANIVDNDKYSNIFVSLELNPSVRHFFEYGPGKELKKSDCYPDQFYLQAGSDHVITKEKSNFSKKSPLDVEADFYIMNSSELTGSLINHFKVYNNSRCVYRKID